MGIEGGGNGGEKKEKEEEHKPVTSVTPCPMI
jgi:hypothetical protein